MGKFLGVLGFIGEIISTTIPFRMYTRVFFEKPLPFEIHKILFLTTFDYEQFEKVASAFISSKYHNL